METYTVTLADEEEKALLWDMISIRDWINNAVYNKVRQCADAIITLALDDITHTILTPADKQDLVSALAQKGIIINTVKGLPVDIKREIIRRANIKSAAEREPGP